MMADALFDVFPTVSQGLILAGFLLGSLGVIWQSVGRKWVTVLTFIGAYLTLVVLGMSTDIKYVNGIGVVILAVMWGLAVKAYFRISVLSAAALFVPVFLATLVLAANHLYTGRGLELMGRWQHLGLHL